MTTFRNGRSTKRGAEEEKLDGRAANYRKLTRQRLQTNYLPHVGLADLADDVVGAGQSLKRNKNP